MKTISLIKSLTFLSILLFSFSVLANDSLTVEEIIAKHLDSIGTKEKRAEIKNQVILSSLLFNYQGSAVIVKGKAVIASDAERIIWGMVLDSNDYPQDKFSYNGESVKVSFIRPGYYSILGDFIKSYKELFKEGLLSGTLSSYWALANLDKRQAKISLVGSKNIDSLDTYILEYMPKNGTDLEIKMFFDKSNFRHIRTEYLRVIGAIQGPTVDGSARQSPDIYQLIENFSDFQEMGGLTLPSKYSISYKYNNNSPTQLSKKKNLALDWKFQITNFSYNQQLDANSFDIDTK